MFALLILRTYSGYEAFTWLGARVTEFLSFADEGAQFVFDKEYYTRHNFAFKVKKINDDYMHVYSRWDLVILIRRNWLKRKAEMSRLVLLGCLAV